MARNPKKQDNEHSVDLPEDRIGQIDKSDPVDKNVKKPQGEDSSTKAKQPKSPRLVIPEKTEDTKSLRDEILLDVRQALISESQEEEQKQGWFQRFMGRLRKTPVPKPAEPELVPLPDVEAQEEIVEPKPKKKRRSGSKQEEIAIQEFFSDLEALADVDIDASLEQAEEAQKLEEIKAEEAVPAAPFVPHLPEKTEDTVEVDFEEVRQVALEEYDGIAVEPVVKVPIQEEIRKTVRELKPFEKMILVGFGVLVAVVLLSMGVFVIVDSITLPAPTPTVVVESPDMIHPIQLSMPGGWVFDLGLGRVVDGKWTPQRAEWLVGTEISRWVALPWSLQLEAVLRTLQSDDQITLTMSNFETLEFNVYSIQELTMEEIQALDPNKPGLLIILFGGEDNSNTHWVVTALP